jgi:hypothetical protein
VLTAPDIDAATFQGLIIPRTFHGPPRAGDSIVIVPGIDVIDASAVDTSLLGHSTLPTIVP